MLLDTLYPQPRTFGGQDYSTKATAREGSTMRACDRGWPLVGCCHAEYNRTTLGNSGPPGSVLGV